MKAFFYSAFVKGLNFIPRQYRYVEFIDGCLKYCIFLAFLNTDVIHCLNIETDNKRKNFNNVLVYFFVNIQITYC